MIGVRGATLRAAGTVALVAAAHQVTTGVAGVRGVAAAPSSPGVDSEMRFYAGWYGVAGLLMHRLAGDPGLDRALGRLVEAGWATAVVARLLSARATGRPAPVFLVLTVMEAALAIVLTATHPADVSGSRRTWSTG